MTLVPRVFVSYSHDSQAHKDWVLKLATRLLANGVEVILDQWDLRLGVRSRMIANASDEEMGMAFLPVLHGLKRCSLV